MFLLPARCSRDYVLDFLICYSVSITHSQVIPSQPPDEETKV